MTADAIIELSKNLHLWSPLFLLIVVVLSVALASLRSIKGSVWTALICAGMIGIVGLFAVEPVHGDGFGNWQLFWAPFVISFWTIIGFCSLWPLIFQLESKGDLKFLCAQIPFFIVGMGMLAVFLVDRFYAMETLYEDRRFWGAVFKESNTKLPIDQYRAHLSSAGKEVVRNHLHDNNSISVSMLRLLHEVGFDVSQEPNVDAVLIREIKEQGDKNQERFVKGSSAANSLNSALAANPATPLELLEEFSGNEDLAVVIAVASNTNAPPQLLERLLKDAKLYYDEGMKKPVKARDCWVLSQNKRIIEMAERSLARNSRTSDDTLHQLSKHPDPEIRKYVIWNKSVPIQIVERMTRDTNMWVQQSALIKIARSDKRSEKLGILSASKDCEIRRSVAMNSSTSEEILNRLLEERDHRVWHEALATLAAKTPIPEERLRKRLEKASVYELEWLADDEGRPRWIYEQLAKSKQRRVRELAEKKLMQVEQAVANR